MVTLHNPPRRKKLSFGPLSLNDRFTIAACCLLFQNNGMHSMLINPALCTRGCPCVACRRKTRPQLLLFPVSSGVSSFYPPHPPQVCSSLPLSKSGRFLWPCSSAACFWFTHSAWEEHIPIVPSTSLISLFKCWLDKHDLGRNVW